MHAGACDKYGTRDGSSHRADIPIGEAGSTNLLKEEKISNSTPFANVGNSKKFQV